LLLKPLTSFQSYREDRLTDTALHPWERDGDVTGSQGLRARYLYRHWGNFCTSNKSIKKAIIKREIPEALVNWTQNMTNRNLTVSFDTVSMGAVHLNTVQVSTATHSDRCLEAFHCSSTVSGWWVIERVHLNVIRLDGERLIGGCPQGGFSPLLWCLVVDLLVKLRKAGFLVFG